MISLSGLTWKLRLHPQKLRKNRRETEMPHSLSAHKEERERAGEEVAQGGISCQTFHSAHDYIPLPESASSTLTGLDQRQSSSKWQRGITTLTQNSRHSLYTIPYVTSSQIPGENIRSVSRKLGQIHPWSKDLCCMPMQKKKKLLRKTNQESNKTMLDNGATAQC